MSVSEYRLLRFTSITSCGHNIYIIIYKVDRANVLGTFAYLHVQQIQRKMCIHLELCVWSMVNVVLIFML